MKIRTKLFGGFFITFAIGLTLGGVGYYSTESLTTSSKNVLNISETRSSVSSILNSHYIWRHGLSETVYSGAAFSGSLDSTTCSLGKWLGGDEVKKMTDSESVTLLRQVVEPHNFIHTKAAEIINHLKNGETNEAVQKFREDVLPKTQEVISGLEKLESRYGVVLDNEIQEIYTSGRASENIIIAFGIVALIASIILAFIITLSIVKPITKISGTFREIGEGNLTVRTVINSKDEMSEFSDNFNLAIEKVRNLILIIKNEAATLNNIGNDLASNMTETAAAMNQITATTVSINGRVLNQSASVSETHATMEQLVANIAKLNGHINTQSESLAHASTSIEEMVTNINSVTQTLVDNAANVKTLLEASEVGRNGLQEVSADIEEIARESEGLLEINAVMENIASQTNLLSMNAAIEAAHAGELGKGFAVVADEIRKLANNSTEQSKTIGTVLKKIKDSIDKITHSTGNVLNKFEAIDQSVKTVAVQESTIRSAMEEQGVGSKQILQGINMVNKITSQVNGSSDEMHEGVKEVLRESDNLEKTTQEITFGMSEMAQSAEHINTAVAHVNDSTNKNRDAINILLREVSRFKVE